MCIENNMPTKYTINGCGASHYYAHTHSNMCGNICMMPHMDDVGFFNYSNYLKNCNQCKIPKSCTIDDVLDRFPCGFKKCGLVVTFTTKDNIWESWQFVGTHTTHWRNIRFWKFLHNSEGDTVLTQRVDEIEQQVNDLKQEINDFIPITTQQIVGIINNV